MSEYLWIFLKYLSSVLIFLRNIMLTFNLCSSTHVQRWGWILWFRSSRLSGVWRIKTNRTLIFKTYCTVVLLGTLINKRYVLTARHCAESRVPDGSYKDNFLRFEVSHGTYIRWYLRIPRSRVKSVFSPCEQRGRTI